VLTVPVNAALLAEDDRVRSCVHACGADTAMKADRRRLAAEKSDLVGQIKQLYSTLKDKEAELRDFIRNYEQRTGDNNQLIKQVGQQSPSHLVSLAGRITPPTIHHRRQLLCLRAS